MTLLVDQRKGLRACILGGTLESAAAENSAFLPMGRLYLPLSHRRALAPDRSLVVAMRGAGKTYWWRQLQDEKLLKLVFPPGETRGHLRCIPGFGQAQNLAAYPSRNVMQGLIDAGFTGEEIWRAVLAGIVRSENRQADAEKDWHSRVAWVRANAEQVDREVARLDKELESRNEQLLILFDALDDAAKDWSGIRELLRGLFRVLVDLRVTRRLRGKAFVRNDLLTPEVANFADASKLLADKAELLWSRADLYALLWQALANEPAHGKVFRDLAQTLLSVEWAQSEGTEVWELPSTLRRDEEVQRRLFHSLAGEWMGKNPRKGFPYPWLPNHLGDAKQQVSPRSFLHALHQAAEISKERYANWDHPLHYDAIKEGVQQASIVRVDELRFEYPWVELAMTALEGILLPCTYEEICARWRGAELLASLEHQERRPLRLEDEFDGLRRELSDLGLFSTLQDGRINVPDVYRIAYKMARKGGIPPVK